MKQAAYKKLRAAAIEALHKKYPDLNAGAIIFDADLWHGLRRAAFDHVAGESIPLSVVEMIKVWYQLRSLDSIRDVQEWKVSLEEVNSL